MRRLCYLLQTLSLNPQGIETQRIFLGASGKQKKNRMVIRGLVMVHVPGQPQEQTAASERPWQKAMTEESTGVREGGSGQKAEN